ncbi:hypothetical protein EJA03_15295 [Vibrio pectenicida]|uniref:Imm33-like domain-containing protein n=2 Tax=Vibrio pectenicida TaxID=62763 RepID=A0A3R9FMY4_9VIBR|nr:hypothetical protein EJA03_15295 [Vibrio pectenicida]
MPLEKKQKDICKKYSISYQECDLNLKVGISKNIKDGVRPLHGLRVKEENGTSGWYIWAGEWSDEPDFFVPLHGLHLVDWADIVMPYLGLPEGWRFLIDEGYEDVWQDPELLNS